MAGQFQLESLANRLRSFQRSPELAELWAALKQVPRRVWHVLAACAALMFLLLAAGLFFEGFFGPDVAVRVLFSETANCSPEERLLVAGVMKNRIAHPAFGNAPSVQAVSSQSGAFSSLADSDNTNWQKSRHPAQLTPAERSIWKRCVDALASDLPAPTGPSGRPLVYYHDRSITKPASWNNARWHAIRELSTDHFIFYSIVPATQPPG
jgi:hypothetical protein